MVDYCVALDTLVISLPKSDIGDLIHAFLHGLKENLQPLVKA